MTVILVVATVAPKWRSAVAVASAAVPVARVLVTNSVVALVVLVKLCRSQYTVVILPI